MPSPTIMQLFPVLGALWRSWIFIVAGGILGALVGACVLLELPSVFEVSSMITMGQVPRLSFNNRQAENTLINIEEPSTLILRLRIPSTYSIFDMNACKSTDTEIMTPQDLVYMISDGEPRSVNSFVILRIRLGTSEVAARCSQALFELIRSQQEAMIEPVRQELLRTKAVIEEQIAYQQNELKSLEEKADNKPLYLSRYFEIFFLNEQLHFLRRSIDSIMPTRLTFPINANPYPLPPHRLFILTVSIFAGLFLGLLVAGIREFMRLLSGSHITQA